MDGAKGATFPIYSILYYPILSSILLLSYPLSYLLYVGSYVRGRMCKKQQKIKQLSNLGKQLFPLEKFKPWDSFII